MKKNEFYKDSFSIFHVEILNKILAFLLKTKAKIKKIEFSKNDQKRLKETLLHGGLITCNHPTDFDPPSLYCLLRKENLKFRIMTARDVMFRTPYIFRKLIQMGGCFSVDRTKFDRKSLSRSIEILSNKKTLIVFPEGRTHGLSGNILPYQAGPIKIALFSSKKTKSPIKILPFAIYYSLIGTSSEKEKIIENRLKELEKMLDLKPDIRNLWQIRFMTITESIIEKLEKEQEATYNKKWRTKESRIKSINPRIKNLCEFSIKKIESELRIKPNKIDSLADRIQKAREANDFTKNIKRKAQIEKKVLMLHSLSSFHYTTPSPNTTYEKLEGILTSLSKELFRVVGKKFTIKTQKKCHLALGETIEIKSSDSNLPEALLEKLEENTKKALKDLEKNNGTIIGSDH